MESDFRRRFSGSVNLYGEAGFERLRGALAVVVGLGGVGSWAAEALARAGVGRLALIDLDNVAPSNLNRQAHATLESVGDAKVDAMQRRIRGICPECEIVKIEDFVDEGNWGGMIAPLIAGRESDPGAAWDAGQIGLLLQSARFFADQAKDGGRGMGMGMGAGAVPVEGRGMRARAAGENGAGAVAAESARARPTGADVEALSAKLAKARRNRLGYRGVFVIDAIDQTAAKAAIAYSCLALGIPFAVSGASGGKRDPSRLALSRIEDARGDKLLSALRAKLRRRYGVVFPSAGDRPFNSPFAVCSGKREPVWCVCSSEPAAAPASSAEGAACGAPPRGPQGLSCAGYGSSMAVTASFGLMLASIALNALAGESPTGARARALGSGAEAKNEVGRGVGAEAGVGIQPESSEGGHD